MDAGAIGVVSIIGGISVGAMIAMGREDRVKLWAFATVAVAAVIGAVVIALGS